LGLGFGDAWQGVFEVDLVDVDEGDGDDVDEEDDDEDAGDAGAGVFVVVIEPGMVGGGGDALFFPPRGDGTEAACERVLLGVAAFGAEE